MQPTSETDIGIGASITNSIEDIWEGLRERWTGEPILIEHYPASESFPDDGEHLDQVVVSLARVPAWRRVWPVPQANPDHARLAGWMEAHGHVITL